jgi:hypothetical protein
MANALFQPPQALKHFEAEEIQRSHSMWRWGIAMMRLPAILEVVGIW